MPLTFYGNTQRSTNYLYYSWNRSPRDPKTKKLLLRNNALVRKAAQCAWPSTYSGQPGMLYTLSQSDGLLRSQLGSSTYARAYAKFREAAWGDVQASLAVDYAERKDSIRMLGQTLSRLLKAVLAVKRGRFGDAAQHLTMHVPDGLNRRRKTTYVDDVLAQNWLAYRLGWTPLVLGVDSLLQTIDRPLSYTYRFVRGSSRRDYDFKLPSPSYDFYHDLYLTGKYGVTIKGKVEVSDPSLARLNQFGLLNPLSVAWELTFLSFMVDRIVRIGDYLDSFDDFVGLSFKDLSITDSIIGYESWKTARSGSLQPIGTDIVKAAVQRKTRILSSTVPIPDLQWGKGLLSSVKYAADAAALSHVLLRRK